MSSFGIIKRIIPFLITLLVGLFIASFFVDLTPRPFAFERRGHRCQDWQGMYWQEHNQRLRAEEELDRINQNPINLKHSMPWEKPNEFVPPPRSGR